jgi:hypothetical protein
MSQNRLLALLRTLAESKSEFIVVGGLAAVLRGAPVQTYDLDILFARDPENIERLLAVLESLDAIFRIQPERRLKPTASHLLGAGHLNLLTNDGPLDLLATIGENSRFEDLLPHSSKMNVGTGFQIQVLDLETLIEVKERLGGEKDIAVLPILRATLRESKKGGNP